MFREVAALLLSACALVGQAQPPRDRRPIRHDSGTATISGRVVAVGTNDPIRKARVVAQADVGRIPPVFTDTDGRFTIAGLVAARYTLGCTKPGYARTTLQRTENDSPARIDVADGANVGSVELRMPKAAAIMGRVVDGFGEPVSGARVAAEVVGSAPPGRPLIVTATAETDDLGEYRLSGLPPGSFVVGVRALLESVVRVEMPDDVRFSEEYGVHTVFFDNSGATILSDFAGSVRRVYYPGGVSVDRAQAITLAAGDEQSAIDFAVTRPQPRLSRGWNPPMRPPDGSAAKPSGVIRGRILDAGGRPLARARVRLLVSSSGLVGPRIAVTGDDGGYEFRDVAAGAYRVAASRTGYASVELGQRHPLEPGQRLWIEHGATLDHIDIVLARHGVITGRILDENGDPLEGAAVQMLQTRYISGRRRLAMPANTSTARTNDLGRYRLDGVPAGAYLVSAEIGQVLTTDFPGYTRTYFPGTVSPADAQIVSVASAQQIGDVDFALQQTRTATVAGRVLDSQGNPWSGAVVMSPSDRSGAAFALSTGARVDPGGLFEFPNVAPGEYVVRAFRSRLNPSIEGEFASQFVTVTGSEGLVSVEMHASAGATLNGRVVLEGAGAPNRGNVELSAVPADPDLSPVGTGAFAVAEIRDHWTFELRGITGPRRFRLAFSTPVSGWGLKAVLMRGRDVTDTLIPFAAGEDFSGIDVVLTDRITRLTGSVSGNRGGTVSDYAAIVFSADRDRWYPQSRFLRLVRPSIDGVVDVQGMPPGEYFAAAIDRGPVSPEADDWQDPAFLESIASRATRVMLTEGLTATANLKLIAR